MYSLLLYLTSRVGSEILDFKSTEIVVGDRLTLVHSEVRYWWIQLGLVGCRGTLLLFDH